MLKQTMTIQLVNGFEARPVAVLVQLASQFDCSVYLETEGKRVNAKSIMGMMSLGLDMGVNVQVEADGSDEQEAINKISYYLSGKE